MSADAAILRRSQKALFFALICAFTLLFASKAKADDKPSTCSGPPECCPAELTDESKDKQAQVDIGVVLVGIYEINEKNSTWNADFYLTEKWAPLPGFAPQTEIFNEVNRTSEQFDRTVLVNGRCERERRIRSTLHNPYNLRVFPFDKQRISLVFSDAVAQSKRVHYPDKAITAGIDEPVLQQLSAWKVEEPTLNYSRAQHAFKWEEGSPDYDYATFSAEITRHVSFHIGKYFLPLLVIVLLSFGVFWIDPEDLGSSISVSVTCLLAAVALQFTEGGSLPDVNYLTISDRMFTVCYVVIALAVLQTIYTNRLTRADMKDKALKLDRRCRLIFPIGLVVALTLAILRAFTQGA